MWSIVLTGNELPLAGGFDKGLQFIGSKIAEAKVHVRGDGPSAKRIESPTEKPAGFDYSIKDKAGNPIALSTLVKRSRGKALKRTLHRLDRMLSSGTVYLSSGTVYLSF